MINWKHGLLAVAALLTITTVSATNYYVDPAAGAITNDGSSTAPWNTLQAVAASKTFSGGDTVFCLNGYHGAVSVTGMYTEPVVFMAAPGARPRLKSYAVNAGRRIELDGFTITPEATEPYRVVENLVSIAGGVTYAVVRNCSLYSVRDASGWTRENWDYSSTSPLVCSGVILYGSHCTVSNNYLTNVRFGIKVVNEGSYNLIEHNTVNRFSEDGLRMIGDYNTVQYNDIMNSYVVNVMHADALQSWPVATNVRKGMILRGNRFLIWDTAAGPFSDYMQGIGCHNAGTYEDWVIENNLIVTNSWVGISMYSTLNCTIVNNTILTVPGGAKNPGILLGAVGNAGGNVVRNNLAMSMSLPASGMTADHNLTGALAKVAVADYAGMDFSLRAGTGAVDGGSAESAPVVDIAGNPRPAGAAIDIGCYEYQESAGAGYHPAHATKPLPGLISNPAVGTAEFRPAGEGTLSIRAGDGTLVRSVRTCKGSPVRWNGKDDTGSPVADGMYHARFSTGSGTATCSFMYIR